MKKIMMLLTLMLISSTAIAGELDGKTFCRTVDGGGIFGQRKKTSEHCVSFEQDTMHDSANTFFGSPPETVKYVLVAGKVLIVQNNMLSSPYSINETGDLLSNNVGAILNIK